VISRSRSQPRRRVSPKINLASDELATELTHPGGRVVGHRPHTSNGEPDFRVVEGVPPQLWSEIEVLHREWQAQGELTRLVRRQDRWRKDQALAGSARRPAP
jgi:hypothetical protein